MLKQLSAGIVSLGMMSTITAPLMAQTVSGTSTKTNSVPTNNLLVEDYSNLYSTVPQIEGESNNLAVKNTLSFADISVAESDTSEFDLLSQRRTRSSSSKYKYSAGFGLVNFGWVKDTNGVIKSILGLNLGLGIGYQRYINPKGAGNFNFGWQVGTILLVVPIAGVFGEYQWDEGWFVGASANVFPVAFFADDFLFPVFPFFRGGYRWD